MRVLVLALAAFLGFAVPSAHAADAQTLVNRAAVGDMFEVQASRMALHLSREDAVRDFARRTIVAHNEDMVALKRAADAAGLEFPEKVDARRREILDTLMQSGDRFTPRYLAALAEDNREVLKLLEGYAARGDRPQLRAHAAAAAPQVRAHIAAIEALQ